MTVKNDGELIQIEDGDQTIWLTREDCFRLLEDLASALNACPFNPNAPGQTPAAEREMI